MSKAEIFQSDAGRDAVRTPDEAQKFLHAREAAIHELVYPNSVLSAEQARRIRIEDRLFFAVNNLLPFQTPHILGLENKPGERTKITNNEARTLTAGLMLHEQGLERWDLRKLLEYMTKEKYIGSYGRMSAYTDVARLQGKGLIRAFWETMDPPRRTFQVAHELVSYLESLIDAQAPSRTDEAQGIVAQTRSITQTVVPQLD